MARILQTLSRAKLPCQPMQLLRQPLTTTVQPLVVATDNRHCLLSRLQNLNIDGKRCSSYDAYPKYHTPSPYKKPRMYRYGYQYKYWKSGLLPRPKGHFEDEPLPLKVKPASSRDAWTNKKALFGQNDYIDILGDGTVHPSELMEGPQWLRAFKGNEFQRLLRQLKYDGERLKAHEPERYHNICKRLFFLYKMLNRNKRAPFWGNRRRASKSRIDTVRADT